MASKKFDLEHCSRIALFQYATIAHATLRIVSYNIDDADQGNDNNITATYAGLPAVLQAIGQHHIGTNVQPIDVLGVEELNPTTLANLVNALNNIYGAGTYAYDPTNDPTTGAGDRRAHLQHAYIKVVSTAVIGTASGSGVPRAPLRYLLRPIGYGTGAEFYIYVSHYKASSGFETRRDFEATEIRQNADALVRRLMSSIRETSTLLAVEVNPAWGTLTSAGNGPGD